MFPPLSSPDGGDTGLKKKGRTFVKIVMCVALDCKGMNGGRLDREEGKDHRL